MVMLPTEDVLQGRSEREWAEDLHESMGYVQPQAELIEETWQKEVLPAIVVQEGNRREISIGKLKAEMFELLWARNTAQRVYHHITGGLTANLTISSEGIIAMHERVVEERISEAVKAALEKRDSEES